MKLTVRKMEDGRARLDLVAESGEEIMGLLAFVELLNGGPLDAERPDNPVFDLPLRIESAGFADEGNLESIAIEGP